jgi:hypothetical protein
MLVDASGASGVVLVGAVTIAVTARRGGSFASGALTPANPRVCWVRVLWVSYLDTRY